MVTVGTRLRIIRKDAGLSQVELGKLAGSNQSAINRYETDRAAVPLSHVDMVCAVFRCIHGLHFWPL